MNPKESLQQIKTGSEVISDHLPGVTASDLVQNINHGDNLLLKNILSNLPLIVSVFNHLGIMTFTEGGILSKQEIFSSEWVGKSVFQKFSEDQELISIFRQTLRGEVSHTVRKSGDVILDLELIPFVNSLNESDGFLCVAIDITEKIASQEEIRKHEERFRKIFQVNPIPMCITELDTGILVDVNDSFLSALHSSREEILGQSASQIGFWPSKEKRKEVLDKVKTEGAVSDLYFDFISSTGQHFYTVLSATQIYIHGETFLLSCIKDVTREYEALKELEILNENLEARVSSRTAELQNAHTILNEEDKKRNQLYRALQQTEAKWRSLVSNAPDTILTLNIEGMILYINRSISSSGIEEIIGRSIFEFINEDDILKAHQILEDVFTTGRQQVMETEGLNTDGKLTLYSCRIGAMVSGGEIIAAMVIATDITQKKQAEQELVRRRAELAHLSRLSTMGELAAELSHELNQPLAAINNYTNGCIRRIRSGTTSLEKLIEPLEETSRQAQRASKTLKRLRRHVQKTEVEYKPIDVNLVIKNSVLLLEHEIQRNSTAMRMELSPKPLETIGDAIQIEQVLVNLILNAIEAMSELPVNERKLIIQSDPAEEQNLVICVTDFGSGLKKDEEISIFETFYTTKQKGLGVGLSISQTIIEAHGGKLYPRRNKIGTSFLISLPMTNGDQYCDI